MIRRGDLVSIRRLAATAGGLGASGTGELEGIAGSMSIEIKDGQHFYVFEYTLPGDS